MAVANKGKRKININGVSYRWFVRESDEGVDVGANTSLSILSENKDFHIAYPIGQTGEHDFVIVIGPLFGGQGAFGKTWQRILCPTWRTADGVTPRLVREIVEWALSEKTNVFVTYLGAAISDHGTS